MNYFLCNILNEKTEEIGINFMNYFLPIILFWEELYSMKQTKEIFVKDLVIVLQGNQQVRTTEYLVNHSTLMKQTSGFIRELAFNNVCRKKKWVLLTN